MIVAFGFRASPPNWAEDYSINLKQNGLVDVDCHEELDFQTTNPKIFSGGDMVRGSDLVVTAIWEGREAAKSIIKFITEYFNNKTIKLIIRLGYPNSSQNFVFHVLDLGLHLNSKNHEYKSL